MIDELLGRIASTAAGYPQVLPDEVYGQVEVHFVLPKGATDQQLMEAEREIGLPLPASVRTVLLRWNAPCLFVQMEVGGRPDMPIDGFFFLSTEKFTRLKEAATRELDDQKDLVLVATGHGYEILVDPDDGAVFVHEEYVRGRYQRLFSSLEDFLERLLDSQGHPFWIEEN